MNLAVPIEYNAGACVVVDIASALVRGIFCGKIGDKLQNRSGFDKQGANLTAFVGEEQLFFGIFEIFYHAASGKRIQKRQNRRGKTRFSAFAQTAVGNAYFGRHAFGIVQLGVA